MVKRRVESLAKRRERACRLGPVLALCYPDLKVSLDWQSPLELLVATILSAQCTDERVNRVTPDLFERYSTAFDYAGADRDELEGLIRSTGFYRNKAKNIQGMGRVVVDTHVKRVAARLGLTGESDPVRVERDLMEVIPPAEWHPLAWRLILHGRFRCSARRPDCAGCEVQALCPSADVG
jgi:endonuclease-3